MRLCNHITRNHFNAHTTYDAAFADTRPELALPS
jgi:hypothetical protein